MDTKISSTKITYKTNIIPDTALIIELYKSAGLNRPVDDKERISNLYVESNLVLTSWDDEKLIGLKYFSLSK